MNVGIIGGGALGLSAAYQLTKLGHKPVVHERAPFLGGQASTFEVGGGRLERGYHHLFWSDRYMVDLIHELGLGPKLAWIESKVGFFHGGRIYPFTTPMDLLRFKPLSFPNRVRAGLMTLRLQRKQYWPREFESLTADAWMRKANKQVFDVIWGPMLRGKFGERAGEVSMAWLWGKVYLRTASRKGTFAKEVLGYPMGSFGEVFERLEQAVRQGGGEVHYPSAVQRVVVENGCATGLAVRLKDGREETRQFDAILSTTPSYLFPRLVPELPAEYVEKLTHIVYQAAVVVVITLDRPLTPVYWMNIADRSIPFVALIEHTNFVDKSHYGGKHIVYLSNYLSKGSEYYNMTPEQLWQAYIPSLKKINPAFDEKWVTGYTYYKEDAAQPIIGLDYSKRIPPLQTPIKDLWLANTTQIYPEDRGTNYSVRLGRLVAKMIAGTEPVKMWWE
ncbi:MAG: NAD(P)/FAD-dependent oxidoreductase [Chloroflexi bacterium]|nr:NAD(P)/FAD-dependent oxidoreductase [Chloroflexota bacterium]